MNFWNKLAALFPSPHDSDTSKQSIAMTWRDIAKDALRERGVPYSSDILDRITAQLPAVGYSAVAAACAERLLSRHLRLPSAEQRPFTASCRHPLDSMWGVLTSQPNSPRLRGEIESWLQNYYNSPLNHSDGEDGPDDADHDPAAAFIYAAESLLQQSPESAGYAMSRLLDDAFYRAADAREAINPPKGNVDEYIADCCHPIVQNELAWLQSVFAYVQSHPLGHQTVSELRHRAHV